MQFAEEHLKLLAVFEDGQRAQQDFDRVRESFDAAYNQKTRVRPAPLVTRKIVNTSLPSRQYRSSHPLQNAMTLEAFVCLQLD